MKKNLQSLNSNEAVIKPTYRQTEFHHAQGGDYKNLCCTGWHSSFDEEVFNDEIVTIFHGREGVVSMANRGKDTNASQLFITLGKKSITVHLDGKQVAFGEVVEGMDIILRMATLEENGCDRHVAMQRIFLW